MSIPRPNSGCNNKITVNFELSTGANAKHTRNATCDGDNLSI